MNSDRLAYIAAHDVRYTYKKGGFAVNLPELSLYSEEIVFLTGPNGGGKSTLGRLLAGITKPDSGTVTLCGRDTAEMELGEIGACLGYVWQDVTLQFFAETVLEDMTLADTLNGVNKSWSLKNARSWLEFFSLSGLEDAPISKLSGGERARLALAGTLQRGARFLVLDEPAANLDDKSLYALTEQLLRLRYEKGTGMLIVSHDMALIHAFADRVLTVRGGEVTDDVYTHRSL